MNKIKKLGLFVVSAMLCSGVAFAQNQKKEADKTCPGTECCETTECVVGKKGNCEFLFEGITLSQAQKDKIATLKTQKKVDKQRVQKENKQFKNDMRMRRDSVAKAQKKEYLSDMKQILEPDQYVIFLENMVVNAPAGQRGSKVGMPGHGKMHKPGKPGNGPRPERPQAAK
ncbi:MAG: hypothetical protein NC343_04525 [Muribaculum sp.]|nr:hypothetical protein [Muribaculaceae bacterium]MCM1080996.1 hypothetical protein [Muribaculum sp.]